MEKIYHVFFISVLLTFEIHNLNLRKLIEMLTLDTDHDLFEKT